MKRRSLVLAVLSLPFAAGSATLFGATRSGADIEAMRARWRDFLAPGFKPPAAADTLQLDESQWRARLSAEQFHVLREEGTERPFTSALNDEKRTGIFACAGCELPLFSSEMKYDPGTGWPSFFTTIPGAVQTKRDFAIVWPRTEYHCARCGGHQGHVFEDGPAQTGERWCNNGVALAFLAAG